MVKVFSLSSMPGNDSEIGQFTDLIQIISSSQGRFQFHASELIRVDILGWKTPMPVALGPPRIESNPQREVKNLELIVAALVNMLGGAVIISTSEVENAVKFELSMTQMESPRSLVIAVKDEA